MDIIEEIELGFTDIKKETLAKGLKIYSRNSENIEWDIFLKGASEYWLHPLDAYNNVYNTVERLYDILIGLEFKVAYGYFKINEQKYVRSSFFVRGEEVLDTNRHFFRKLTEMEYITFYEMDIQDYVVAIIKENGDLGLREYLREYEIIWDSYAKDKGIQSLR